jgi:hypothetical protein
LGSEVGRMSFVLPSAKAAAAREEEASMGGGGEVRARACTCVCASFSLRPESRPSTLAERRATNNEKATSIKM